MCERDAQAAANLAAIIALGGFDIDALERCSVLPGNLGESPQTLFSKINSLNLPTTDGISEPVAVLELTEREGEVLDFTRAFTGTDTSTALSGERCQFNP